MNILAVAALCFLAVIAAVLYFHRHRPEPPADFRAFLSFRSIWRYTMSLDLTLGDTAPHQAKLTCTNLDGTLATDVTVTYTSDSPGVVTVDVNTGVLTLVGVGNATITGTGNRGAFSHSDVGTVTVAAAAPGDFTATLSLT